MLCELWTVWGWATFVCLCAVCHWKPFSYTCYPYDELSEQDNVATARSNTSNALFRASIKLYFDSYISPVLPFKWSDNNSICAMTQHKPPPHSITNKLNRSFSYSKAISTRKERYERVNACRKYVLEQLKINKKFIELDNSMRMHSAHHEN